MKLGAGFLMVCPTTQRILLALRNDPKPVWSVFGGSLEKYETPIQCAKRELIEEAGFIEGHDYKVMSTRPLNIGKYTNFVYRTFIGITETEIVPTLNYEHIEYRWVSMDEIPDNRHFGLQQMMGDPKTMKRLESALKSNVKQ
jgi:8-oxo-dGTP pyrophosphatase MutT (NUDIX family)